MVAELLTSSCGTGSGGSTAEIADQLLTSLGVPRQQYTAGTLFARSPINGARIGKLRVADSAMTDQVMARSERAAAAWAQVSPSTRGEAMRRVGEKLRTHRRALADLITLETGVAPAVSTRKVDYVIGCCDQAFATVRELSHSSFRAQRKGYWTLETWRPLGVSGCISPFNRPVSHFASFAFKCLVCGNSVVWKPSESGSLTALALATLIMDGMRSADDVPEELVSLLFGGRDIGKTLSEDFRLRFLDAATCTPTGRALNIKLAQSFTRGALSLSGNNAAIVCPSADMPMAINAIAASATLASGQHGMCLRRLFVHTDIYDRFVDSLARVFEHIPVGDPRQDGMMMGPLIDRNAYESMQRILLAARREGGTISGGTRVEMSEQPGAYYVRPAIVQLPEQIELMLRESLVPVLFVVRFDRLEDAIAMDSASEAGLSSTIFTRNMAETHTFMQSTRAGMAYINTFNAGYDLGFATYGAKSSGGGRLSSGSSWKVFMQRCIVTMNLDDKDGMPDALGMVERGEI